MKNKKLQSFAIAGVLSTFLIHEIPCLHEPSEAEIVAHRCHLMEPHVEKDFHLLRENSRRQVAGLTEGTIGLSLKVDDSFARSFRAIKN